MGLADFDREGPLWLAAAAAGESQAFHQLYMACQPHVFRFCFRMLGDAARAEDACQETFVDLYRVRSKYKPSGSFKSFLFTLAANRCRKMLRARRDSPLPDNWDAASEAAGPEATLLGRETTERLTQAFAALPEKQRLALTLVHEQGLSYDEAALALGASLGAVKTWIFRARAALQQVLEVET